MPSKSRNGNSPLGNTRLEGAGGFARTELEISKRTPKQSMTSGLIQTPSGAIHAPKRRRKGGGTTVPCQLGRVSVDSVNSTPSVTKYKINAGFLTGGGGTELIEPDNLTATIGDFVWLSVAWTVEVILAVGEETEDKISAGGTIGDVTISTGSDVPDDTIPTVNSASGVANIALGGWISNGAEEPAPLWVNQGCGSIQIYFCPGNGFFYGRNNQVTA